MEEDFKIVQRRRRGRLPKQNCSDVVAQSLKAAVDEAETEPVNPVLAKSTIVRINRLWYVLGACSLNDFLQRRDTDPPTLWRIETRT